MTINIADNSPRISYTVGQGVTQSSFAVPFEFFNNTDLNVYVDGTLKTITTHYTVTGGDGSTGTISMSVTGGTGGSTVVITRDIALERTTDFPVSGAFNIVSLNTELDRLIAIAADLDDLAGRGVKLSDFDTAATLTLPLAADRVNKVLAFNSAGDTLVSQELGVWKGDWAASTAYVERDLVRDSSDGSIYIVTSAHTSSGSTPLDTNTNSSKYSVIFDVGAMLVDTITMSGNLTVNGNTTLGNASSDTIATTGTVSNLRMSSTNVTDILDEDNMSSNSATSLATQQSIKAYVDSQVGASDTLTEILSNGNTTSGANIQLTTTDELQFRDTALKISSSADGQLDIDADTELEITAPTVDINASTEVNISGDLTVDTDTLHVDSSNNRVGIKTTSPDNELTVIGTGFFGASTAGVAVSNSGANLALISGQTPSGTYKPLKISSTDPSSNYLYFDTTSGIGINNDSPSSFNSKLVIGGTSGSNTMTIASGTTGVGNIHFADGTSGDALDEGYIRYHHQYDRLVLGTASAAVEPLRITSSGSVGIKVAGDPSTELEVNGTVTATGFASTGNMTFGDSNKAIFGAGSDLQIYHDGSNSYMLEGGTGSLIVGGTNLYLANGDNSKAFLRGTNNADVALYYNNSIKLATTSTGVDVTGTVTADGLTVDESNNVRYSFSESGTGHAYLTIRAGYNTKDSQITFSNNTNSTTGSINYDHTSNFMKFSTNGANERMRIDSSGQVMIGTTSASYPFTVQSTGTSTVHVKTTATNGAAQLRLENDAKAYAVGVGSSDQLYIYDNTNGANRIVVDTNGNVGINKGTPSSYQSYRYLDVAGASSGQGGVIQVMTSGQEARGQWNVDSGGVRLQAVTNHSLSFYTNATQRMTIASYGSVGIGTSTPTNFSTYRYLDIMGSATTTGGVIQLKTSDSSVNLNMYSYNGGGVFGTATNHNLAFTTNNSVKMVILADGKIGVGVTAPSSKIEINHASSSFYSSSGDEFSSSSRSANHIFLNTAGYGNATVISAATGVVAPSRTTSGLILNSFYGASSYSAASVNVNCNTGSGTIQFYTGASSAAPTERMRIDSVGNVGIGTTSPSSEVKLDVDTGANSHAARFRCDTGGYACAIFDNQASSGTREFTSFRINNSAVGTITSTGSTTAYNTSSDHRLKENVVELTGATARLKQLEPKRFNFIADADTTVDGFLAHEVQSVVPEAITGTHNEVDADGNPVYQGIDQSKLVPLLVATIKELEARITALEGE